MKMTRKDFLRGAVAGAAIIPAAGASAGAGAEPVRTEPGRDFGLYDLHVHASDAQTVADIDRKSRELGIPFGVMKNVAPFGIRNDADLAAFLAEVEPYPLWRGLQPMERGWSKNLSKELVARADYVLLDPQTIRGGNEYGDTLEVWKHDCYVPDAEAFMRKNMDHYLAILGGGERMDILGWPLYLPPCIAREYHRLWTDARMERIIDAAKARGVALEINDLAHTPHKEFILRAKAAGLKFTFGSDTRDHRTGRLDFCRRIASECGLVDADFWKPPRRAEGRG